MAVNGIAIHEVVTPEIVGNAAKQLRRGWLDGSLECLKESEPHAWHFIEHCADLGVARLAVRLEGELKEDQIAVIRAELVRAGVGSFELASLAYNALLEEVLPVVSALRDERFGPEQRG